MKLNLAINPIPLILKSLEPKPWKRTLHPELVSWSEEACNSWQGFGFLCSAACQQMFGKDVGRTWREQGKMRSGTSLCCPPHSLLCACCLAHLLLCFHLLLLPESCCSGQTWPFYDCKVVLGLTCSPLFFPLHIFSCTRALLPHDHFHNRLCSLPSTIMPLLPLIQGLRVEAPVSWRIPA